MPVTQFSSFKNSLFAGASAFYHRYFIACVAIVFLAGFGLNVFTTIHRIVSCHAVVPIMDYWRVAQTLPRYQKFDLSVLWQQHNEHRIVFPEIIFAADMLEFHGRTNLPLVTSFACFAGAWLVLAITVLQDRTVDLGIRIATVALSGCLGFWQGISLVLAVPFLLQWTMTQFGVALALFWVTSLARSQRALPMIGVILAAGVATYSSGNSLLLWPLLLVIAFYLRIEMQRVLVLLAAATLTVGTYFVGYHFSPALNARALLSHPSYFLGFLCSYLSLPFGGMGKPGTAIEFGILIFTLMVACSYIGRKQQLAKSRPYVVIGGFALFTLLTAGVTAIGRMEYSDAYFTAAKAVRYESIPQLTWAGVILLGGWLLAKGTRLRTYSAVAVLTALLLSVGFSKLRFWLDRGFQSFSESQLAEISLESHAVDNEAVQKYVFPSLDAVREWGSNLVRSRLSIYDYGPGDWLGQELSNFGPVKHVQSGMITAARAMSNGFQVTGWADDSNLRRRYLYVLLTDESRHVVGLARRFDEGFPASAQSLKLPSPFAWAGYISEKFRGHNIFAYVVLPEGGLLSIDSTILLPREYRQPMGR